MTLKRQLLIASLLTLIIPWAGLQFVLELDKALRQQAMQQLQSQATRLAELAGDRLLGVPAVTADTPVLYIESLRQPIHLDGYGDDWPGYDDEDQAHLWQSAADTPDNNAPTLRWQAAADGQHLFLLIRLHRHRPVFYDPARPDQPHDLLKLWQHNGDPTLDQTPPQQRWFIRTSAPGQVYAQTDQRRPRPDYRISGFWRPVEGGWQVELQLPLPAANARFGFAVFQGETRLAGTAESPPPLVVGRQPELERRLAPYLNPGQHVRVVEPGGWLIAETGRPVAGARPDFDTLSPLQILEQASLNALRGLVQLYQPAPQTLATGERRLTPQSWPDQGLVRHGNGSRWLLVSKPVFGGRALLLEQSLDQLLTLSGTTLGAVIARSTLIIVGLTLVLLGYASWLSWRITRLQKLVNRTVDEDGRITGLLPPARSHDELGQLQQQFSHMVARLQGYNRYLESFSRRLSHELKTPVAIVRSSLENLAHSQNQAEREQYLARASAATERLRQILHGMSEAARLEQSFDHADKETFDLADVAAQATAAYQALDDQHRLEYRGPETGVPMTGSPELMVQMLDKLVDNARDFTPAQGRIEVALALDGDRWVLSVFNEGSRLPAHPATDLFDAFVSHREGSGEGHLGQGLLIVRLIAEFHGARVEADNESRNGIDGVCFRVIIPATP